MNNARAEIVPSIRYAGTRYFRPLSSGLITFHSVAFLTGNSPPT